MPTQLSILGAPSSLGIRPYDDGRERGLSDAPAALRALDVARRCLACDRGDVVPGKYRDFHRRPGTVRNAPELADFSRRLADRVADLVGAGAPVLVLGGDCSIVLGNLLGMRRAGRERVGLVYIDAHSDFASPAESPTGSAASMCLAMAVGRGGCELSQLDGSSPLVWGQDVVLLGRRDHGEQYGQASLDEFGVLDLDASVLDTQTDAVLHQRIVQRVAGPGLDGFWIHIDADVVDSREIAAVDSPEPGGPSLRRLGDLLKPLVAHPAAVGVQLTIYDPWLDHDGVAAQRLGHFLVDLFAHYR